MRKCLRHIELIAKFRGHDKTVTRSPSTHLTIYSQCSFLIAIKERTCFSLLVSVPSEKVDWFSFSFSSPTSTIAADADVKFNIMNENDTSTQISSSFVRLFRFASDRGCRELDTAANYLAVDR